MGTYANVPFGGRKIIPENTGANLIVSASSGTTMMTLFTYLVSILEKQNFSEPERLGNLIHRLFPGSSVKLSKVAGWAGHYAVGVLFVAAYQHLWKTGKIRKTVTNGLLLGALSGALAVVVWKSAMKAQPVPPWVNFTKFYLQLVPAHLVFAVCATLTSKLLDEKSPYAPYSGL